jgi:hypothetical protein
MPKEKAIVAGITGYPVIFGALPIISGNVCVYPISSEIIQNITDYPRDNAGFLAQ